MDRSTLPAGIARIALIVAMRSELQHLPGLPYMPEPVDGDAPWPMVGWRQGSLELTATLCGYGTVPAAAATEAVIREHRPDAILNFGCAGAHRRDLRPGDVVIGTRSVLHSSLVIAPDGEARYDMHDGRDAPAPGQTGIASDPGLVAIARTAATDWQPAPWPGSAAGAARVLEGIVATADIWTQSARHIEDLATRHQSVCEDMEAAAIAAIAALHGVPFLTIKDISNNELQTATVFSADMAHLPEGEVGRRAAALTGRVVDAVAVARTANHVSESES